MTQAVNTYLEGSSESNPPIVNPIKEEFTSNAMYNKQASKDYFLSDKNNDQSYLIVNTVNNTNQRL